MAALLGIRLTSEYLPCTGFQPTLDLGSRDETDLERSKLEKAARDRKKANNAKIEEAKRNGTWVRPKPRRPIMPAYEYADRKQNSCRLIEGDYHCPCFLCDFDLYGYVGCPGCDRCCSDN